MTRIYTAEDVSTPDSPLLSAYEAGRWYALHDRSYPAGASPECIRGYDDALVAKTDED